jgi:hypothetical protein
MMVANLQKNIAAMSAVAMPKYRVCILCQVMLYDIWVCKNRNLKQKKLNLAELWEVGPYNI